MNQETEKEDSKNGNVKTVLMVVLWLFLSYVFYTAMIGVYTEVSIEKIENLQKYVKESPCQQDDKVFKELMSKKNIYEDELRNVIMVHNFCNDVEYARAIIVKGDCVDAISYAKDVMEEAVSNPSYLGSGDSRRSRQMDAAVKECEYIRRKEEIYNSI